MESVEAVTGSLHLKRQISGAFLKTPVLCFGCSSRHTRKVTGRDNSALGSSVVKLPSHAGQGSAPARCTACPGREERRSSPFVTKTGKGDRDATAQAHMHRHKHCAPFVQQLQFLS